MDLAKVPLFYEWAQEYAPTAIDLHIAIHSPLTLITHNKTGNYWRIIIILPHDIPPEFDEPIQGSGSSPSPAPAPTPAPSHT
jgi:hypothetical protein